MSSGTLEIDSGLTVQEAGEVYWYPSIFDLAVFLPGRRPVTQYACPAESLDITPDHRWPLVSRFEAANATVDAFGKSIGSAGRWCFRRSASPWPVWAAQ